MFTLIVREESILQMDTADAESLFAKVEHLVTEPEWKLAQPLVEEIRELKDRRNAVILAHNYQHPLIFHGVADLHGSSLGLARQAAATDAEVIVMCGVEFMAETASLINPDSTVLLPDDKAGCSLADSISAADVRELREQHPGVPVVTYVNTSAAVKAECDVSCTSSNAVEVVEALDSDRVLLVPDEHLADYVDARTDKEILTWEGACVVHEEFRLGDIEALREDYPGIRVIAHPECTEQVQQTADFIGSTSGLIDWLEEHQPEKVAMITECTMSDNVAERFPDVEFIQPCSICPYMRRITLEGIRDCLRELSGQVQVEPDIAADARRCVERMFELSL